MAGHWNRRATIGALSAISLGSGTSFGRDAVGRKAHTNLVAEMAPTGRLRVAINLGNVVLARKGGLQGAAGPSVDIANALGKRLGVPVDLVIYETAGQVVARLYEDRWDIAFLAIDPARAGPIAFTPPYVFIDGTYLVRNKAPYQRAADLDRSGVRIAVGLGAAYDLYLTRALKNATLIRAPTSNAAIERFIHEDLEAVAGVRQALVEAQRALPDYRVLVDNFSRIEQAIAIPVGRDAALPFLSSFLENLKASGFIRSALDRAGQAGAQVAPPTIG